MPGRTRSRVCGGARGWQFRTEDADLALGVGDAYPVFPERLPQGPIQLGAQVIASAIRIGTAMRTFRSLQDWLITVLVRIVSFGMFASLPSRLRTTT